MDSVGAFQEECQRSSSSRAKAEVCSQTASARSSRTSSPARLHSGAGDQASNAQGDAGWSYLEQDPQATAPASNGFHDANEIAWHDSEEEQLDFARRLREAQIAAMRQAEAQIAARRRADAELAARASASEPPSSQPTSAWMSPVLSRRGSHASIEECKAQIIEMTQRLAAARAVLRKNAPDSPQARIIEATERLAAAREALLRSKKQAVEQVHVELEEAETARTETPTSSASLAPEPERKASPPRSAQRGGPTPPRSRTATPAETPRRKEAPAGLRGSGRLRPEVLVTESVLADRKRDEAGLLHAISTAQLLGVLTRQGSRYANTTTPPCPGPRLSSKQLGTRARKEPGQAQARRHFSAGNLTRTI